MFLTGLLPLLLMLLVLHGSITSRFSGNEPLLLLIPEKGEAENQPYVIFGVFLLLSLLLLFVCLLLFYFVFFFSM